MLLADRAFTSATEYNAEAAQASAFFLLTAAHSLYNRNLQADVDVLLE